MTSSELKDRGTVSVVIPTYNRAREVCRAVESALQQTRAPLEVIVADDGSTDGTEQALAGYGGPVRYLRIPHSGLPARARNAGIAEARGDYIAFLDSDDAWLVAKLERQAAVLDANPEVGLVSANALLVKGDGDEPSGAYLPDDRATGEFCLADLLYTNFVITSTAVARRSVLLGGFDEDRRLRAIEDYDLWLRMSLVSRVHYIAEPLAIYRDHSSSIRMAQSQAGHWKGMHLIVSRLRKQRTQLTPEGRLVEEALLQERARLYGKLLSHALLLEERRYFSAAVLKLKLALVSRWQGRARHSKVSRKT